MINRNLSLSVLAAATIAATPLQLFAQGATNETQVGRMPAPSTGQSINQGASQGAGSQKLGQGLNIVAGGVFTAAFISSCSHGCNPMYAYMALSSFASAATMGRAKGMSNLTYDASGNWNTNPGTNTDDPIGTYDPFVGIPDTQYTEERQHWEQLKNDGFTISKDGLIKGPNGQTVKPSDLKNASGMMAAGATAGQASSAMSLMDKVNSDLSAKAKEFENSGSEANVVSMGVDGSGGGAGGGAYNRDLASDDDGGDYMKNFKNPFAMDAKKKKEMVAGKSLAHGDDQIGVKMDDIFQMVHRRYQVKRAGDEFIEPAEASKATPKGLAPKPSYRK